MGLGGARHAEGAVGRSFTGEGNYGRLVTDRRFGRTVVRVIYNVGRGEYVIVAVMRRRRLGGGGGP
jgi:hypothetical protein